VTAAHARDVRCNHFIGGGEVKARGLTLVVAVAILMLVTGCSPPREIPQPTTAPPTAEQAGAPEMVLVPSLEDAIRSVDATATYEQDPRALLRGSTVEGERRVPVDCSAGFSGASCGSDSAGRHRRELADRVRRLSSEAAPDKRVQGVEEESVEPSGVGV
jgi:hypothetical protein